MVVRRLRYFQDIFIGQGHVQREQLRNIEELGDFCLLGTGAPG